MRELRAVVGWDLRHVLSSKTQNKTWMNSRINFSPRSLHSIFFILQAKSGANIKHLVRSCALVLPSINSSFFFHFSCLGC